MLEFYRFFIVGNRKKGRYLELNAGSIVSTIQKLEGRIRNRFPDSGLLQVCTEFEEEANQARIISLQLSQPIWLVRLAAILAGILLLMVAFSAISALIHRFSIDGENMAEVLQASEAALNELIFLGLALYFLLGLEKRIKQPVALKSLHRLRSLAHIVDMHQLTKDPASLLNKPTEKGPAAKPALSRFEITRYLDYCSEMLALISKVAALFAQYMDDPVILAAVNDIQNLSQGLSGKIWQKIMILDLAEE